MLIGSEEGVVAVAVAKGEKYAESPDGSGDEMVRREAVEAEREMVWLREKKRRVDAERFTGVGLGMNGERGGERGPRSSLSRCTALSQSVQGWWCDSPMWPQPLLRWVLVDSPEDSGDCHTMYGQQMVSITVEYCV